MAYDPREENLGDDLFSKLAIPSGTIDTSEPESIGYEEEDENWQDELRRDESILGDAGPRKKRFGKKPKVHPNSEDYTVSNDTAALVSLEKSVAKPSVDSSLDDFFGTQDDETFDDTVDEHAPALPSFGQPVHSPPFDSAQHSQPDDLPGFDQPFDDDPFNSMDDDQFPGLPGFDQPFEDQFADDTEFDVGSIDIEGTIEDAEQSSKRKNRIIGAVTAVALAFGVAFGVNWLITFNAERGIADVSDDIDTSFIAEPQQIDTSEITGEFSANGAPVWELDADEARLMSVYRAGILQIHDGTVKLRNTNTGEIIEETEIDEAIETTYETVDAEGNPAVGYRTDTQITVISGAGVESWDVDEELTLVASGDIGLLVDAQSYTAKAVVPGEEKLVDATYDENLMLSGADQDHLLQPISNTPRVELVDFDGEEREVIELAPPQEQMTFIRHLSVGHGLSLALWDLEDVRLATTHSLEDGQPISTVPVEVAEGWSIGRGADLATMGRYAIEISTGHFIVEADRELSGAVNTVPFVEESGNRVIIVEGQALRQSNRLRGVTESVVVIENGDSSISVYPHAGSPDQTISTHGGGLA
ncbi:MAG: hypothetical protein HLX51_00915 [Micrococcaceae bacterium]|nr:hypothetical protein [Micrococcaceae bacterium]